MSRKVQLLNSGWKMLGTPAGAYTDPGSLPKDAWKDAVVPGTVAQSLKTGIDEAPAIDSQDWWYRCSFAASTAEQELRFDGLATLATVWLNGKQILSSRNMFTSHRCAVKLNSSAPNELVIVFRSLEADLAIKRKRPRWKTALVGQQNLRFVRTTLLGRIPGWTPPIAPAGPWKDIALSNASGLDVRNLRARAELKGSVHHVLLTGELSGAAAAEASLHFGGKAYPVKLNGPRFSCNVPVDRTPVWWPHSHGTPHLTACGLHVKSSSEELRLDCGKLGFKTVELDRSQGKVALKVNGSPIFCRGACWTTDDFLSLKGTRLRETLLLAQHAGVNMLRVGGTMVYESDEFYRLCDELGILVWQDFMFANMDYPVSDPEFHEEIVREARQQLERLSPHPSLAVYCGGSEVQQQAAMVGVPASDWSNEFFDRELPGFCSELHPGIPYFPSTPCEGALPFHVSTGISHYYGVGAYRKPLSHLKHAKVAFTPECLGFSNMAEPETMALLEAGGEPLRMARVPRDSGTDWDFRDVSDHYFKELFGTDAASLRSSDPGRYEEASRVVIGEIMKTAYAEWRRPGSGCGGALVWFFKDLWPGAGWGVVDSLNRPKAVYHYLRRAWAPRAVLITDESLDGLQFHVFNDGDQPLTATLGLEVFNQGKIRTAMTETPLELPGRAARSFSGDALLGYFTDLTYSYKFGQPQHDVVHVFLKSDGRILSEDFYFPGGLRHLEQAATDVKASAQRTANGSVLLSLTSACFLQSVHFSVTGYQPEDNYFHLAPGQTREILFHPTGGSGEFKTELRALNLDKPVLVLADGAAG